jgi:hypothetical protein
VDAGPGDGIHRGRADGRGLVDVLAGPLQLLRDIGTGRQIEAGQRGRRHDLDPVLPTRADDGRRARLA